MATTYETIQYIDSNGYPQEVALVELSLNGTLRHWLEPKSHTWSEYHIVLPQPPEVVANIPFKSQCKIFACRQSANGAQNTFSGGSILFQGRRTDNPASASAQKVNNEIVLFDALWDLKNITYQIPWNYISGGTQSGGYQHSTFNFADVVLFTSNLNLGLLQPDGTFQPYNPAPIAGLVTTWQQIQTVVNYALFYLRGTPDAINLQLSAIQEFTTTYCPVYTCRAMKCLDVLTICLRPHPMVYTEVDYTTTPPTLHFRYAGNLTPITLPYKGQDGAGNIHIASDIRPLPELVPARVILEYQLNSELNGQPVISYTTDAWPPNIGPSLLDQVFSIDVKGASVISVTKNFTSYDFDPTDLTLWRDKVPALKEQSQGGQIPNDGQKGALNFISTAPYDPVANPKGIQVIDHKNNPIDFADTYLYWTNQSVYAWFTVEQIDGDNIESIPAQAIKATVKAFFTYSRKSTIGTGANTYNLTDDKTEHEHSMRITLTNVPSGFYSLQEATSQGEAIPIGLAETIWNELQWLQYKIGSHENFQVGKDANTPPQIIKPGKNSINLTGGLADWQDMNAVPETVKIEFSRVLQNVKGIPTWCLAAKHTISCGPVNHLNPEYMVQLANIFNNRKLTSINPNQLASGTTGSQMDLSAEEATDSAIPSPEIPATQNIVTPPNPNTGQVSAVKTSASDLNIGDQVKLTQVCAIDASGNLLTNYYAYGPQNPPS